MDLVKIFVSHSSKYSEIAKSLKLSLHTLETTPVLDVRISEDMAGASDWRRWIDDNVRSADVFLLLYPDAGMEMGWCNYELGRFDEDQRQVVCIKNTDIPNPPPVFERYQAYDADDAGFLKFLNELFVSGSFTGQQPLNPAVGSVTDRLYDQAKSVARALAQQFAEARVQHQVFESNIAISLRYSAANQAANQLDRDASTVEGNADGLRLLGFDNAAIVPWSKVQQTLGANIDWPAELEKALPSITAGSLPPTLPPFRLQTGMYIPVVASSESVDGVLRKLDLMFVEASPERLRPLLDWSLPSEMPDLLAYLIRLFRMMFRARWEILEPRFREVSLYAPAADRCAEIARAVMAEYDQMRNFAEHEGMGGFGKFYTAFRHGLRDDVEACGAEWMQLTEQLRSAAAPDAHELTGLLKALLDNNAKWLAIGAKQFSALIADLG